MELPPEAEGQERSARIDTSAFAGELANAKSEGGLYRLIVESTARAIRAQLGVLATYEEHEGHLVIGATHGYPAALVEDVRIAPGSGVIGSVFRSRDSLLVSDIGSAPGGRPRRLRYRTPSFLAIPLVVRDEALGVLSFADRADGGPFDEADLAAVRALAAPAALALACERLSKQKRDLEYAVGVDPLTGLFNRRYFDARLQEEMGRARRHNLDLSLLNIDVDDFKSLNDSHGHLAGDAVLRGVAKVLRRSVRVFDVCIRWGGDEFAILAPGSGASNAALSAERIRQQVERYRSTAAPPVPPDLRVTVSIGGAVLTRDVSSREFVAAADRALYEAKASGKNSVQVDTAAAPG
ncbi:MAG: sensor domain-containing diguanylate cyclase [Deltaproteobacteria bacterium]|nr:MAG: sensor domain-containing diguanylate cyclase [Deltaproteobacteria bacterium]